MTAFLSIDQVLLLVVAGEANRAAVCVLFAKESLVEHSARTSSGNAMRIVAGCAFDPAVVDAYLFLIHSAVINCHEILRGSLGIRRRVPVRARPVGRRESDPDRVVIPQVRADIEQSEIDYLPCPPQYI